MLSLPLAVVLGVVAFALVVVLPYVAVQLQAYRADAAEASRWSPEDR